MQFQVAGLLAAVVIPAQAGIQQICRGVTHSELDSRLRGNDDNKVISLVIKEWSQMMQFDDEI